MESHIFSINLFISYGISQLFVYSCSSNSLMKSKLLSYLWLFYMHLLSLFLDESHHRLVHLSNLFKELIFGFLNHCYFFYPSFIDFYPVLLFRSFWFHWVREYDLNDVNSEKSETDALVYNLIHLCEHTCAQK